MAKVKENNGNGFASIVYYRDWAKALRALPPKLRCKVRDAIDDYVIDGTEPTDASVLCSPYPLIVARIKEDKAKYDERCAKMRINGRKGAAARWDGSD